MLPSQPIANCMRAVHFSTSSTVHNRDMLPNSTHGAVVLILVKSVTLERLHCMLQRVLIVTFEWREHCTSYCGRHALQLLVHSLAPMTVLSPLRSPPHLNPENKRNLVWKSETKEKKGEESSFHLVHTLICIFSFSKIFVSGLYLSDSVCSSCPKLSKSLQKKISCFSNKRIYYTADNQ